MINHVYVTKIVVAGEREAGWRFGRNGVAY